MQSEPDKIAADLAAIESAQSKGMLATLGCYVKLSGPGWLQSAITLGGGSLASSLYLGVLAGYSMLWVQPLAMIMGIIMLSAIAYVTLSTGERPFGAINRHVNPVLGWSWALATLAANMVWSLPQYSLATGVVQQNLMPGTLGADGSMSDFASKLTVVSIIVVLTTFVTWSYGKGSRGVRLYERMLKIVVGLIVLSFIGVVIRLSTAEDGLKLGEVLAGFVPDFGAFNRPAAGFEPTLAALDTSLREYWEKQIVGGQRDVMIAAAATAVGINMTFLLPYTLLARGWGRPFRGLARFDLSTGMLIPFMLATSCVVLSAANRFHTVPVPGLVVEDQVGGEVAAAGAMKGFRGAFQAALVHEIGADTFSALDKEQRLKRINARIESAPVAERRLAAMLVKRDAFDLAQALRPLTGDTFANVLFGFGVLAMALSTITILMLISGFVLCEMFGVEPKGWPLRLGCLAALTGALGPFYWKDAAVYLAVPTSVFGMMLLPIAYWTFFFMMNNQKLLGDALPRGGRRVAWNTAMLSAAGLATVASVWVVWSKTKTTGLICLGGLLVLALGFHVLRPRAALHDPE